MTSTIDKLKAEKAAAQARLEQLRREVAVCPYDEGLQEQAYYAEERLVEIDDLLTDADLDLQPGTDDDPAAQALADSYEPREVRGF